MPLPKGLNEGFLGPTTEGSDAVFHEEEKKIENGDSVMPQYFTVHTSSAPAEQVAAAISQALAETVGNFGVEVSVPKPSALDEQKLSVAVQAPDSVNPEEIEDALVRPNLISSATERTNFRAIKATVTSKLK